MEKDSFKHQIRRFFFLLVDFMQWCGMRSMLFLTSRACGANKCHVLAEKITKKHQKKSHWNPKNMHFRKPQNTYLVCFRNTYKRVYKAAVLETY